MSGLAQEEEEEEEEDYLDEEDLALLHSLKSSERPHLSNPASSSEPNQFKAYDSPKWRRHGLAARWPTLQQELLSLVAEVNRPIPTVSPADVKIHEAGNTPCSFSHPSSSFKPYTFASFLASFPSTCMRFSDLHPTTLDLRTYALYCSHPLLGRADDSPLAVYDSQFGLHPPLSGLYTRPVGVFSGCLFAGCAARPPWQWILLGPERSGTGIHVDPLNTCAWVALVAGLKLWCMFDPGGGREGLGLKGWGLKAGEHDESCKWFEER